jgi:hypothetical protein
MQMRNRRYHYIAAGCKIPLIWSLEFVFLVFENSPIDGEPIVRHTVLGILICLALAASVYSGCSATSQGTFENIKSYCAKRSDRLRICKELLK